MVRIRCLNTLSELRDSGYGQPYPRHGLKLLYWLATECVHVYDDQMMVRWRPFNGNFGFRLFVDNDGLLPATSLSYYEVGNLDDYNAGQLPEYVRKDYSAKVDNSNTDRIIICLNSVWFDSVYVTCQKTQWTFDEKQTYRIGPQLINAIRRMERKDFLRPDTGYHHPRPQSSALSTQQSESWKDFSAAACIFLVVFIIGLCCIALLILLIWLIISQK